MQRADNQLVSSLTMAAAAIALASTTMAHHVNEGSLAYRIDAPPVLSDSPPPPPEVPHKKDDGEGDQLGESSIDPDATPWQLTVTSTPVLSLRMLLLHW